MNLHHARDTINDFQKANPTHPFPLIVNFTSSSSSPHVVLAIAPEHAANIRAGIKDHEFRKYQLPPDAKYLWLYETAPLHGISTIIKVDSLRLPGQVLGNNLGNDDFNKRKKTSQYAFPILQVLRLPHILSSSELLSCFSTVPPYRWCPAPLSLSQHYSSLFP